MLRNYWKTALRSLRRNLSFSLINVIGLAIGMAVSFLILIYVRHEMTYDRFNPGASRTYRLVSRLDLEGREMEVASVPAPFGPDLQARFPEIEEMARLQGGGGRIFAYGDKRFEEERFYHADPGLFDIFAVDVVRGDPRTMLEAPFSLVLTEETAKKYFGESDPIGRTMRVGLRHDYAVTGVVRAMPSNSHFKFDVIGSLSSLRKLRDDFDTYMGFNYFCYLRLNRSAAPEDLSRRFLELLEANLPAQIKQLKLNIELDLQPMTRIHLYSHTVSEMEPSGNPAYIRIFTTIALFILAIASINFMNLSSARSAHRAREVGMRKVLGSPRRSLVFQFLGESLLLSLLGLIAATGLILLLLPPFNRLIGHSLTFSPLSDGPVMLGFLGITVFVGLVSGFYPAVFLSSFQPVDVFRSRLKAGRGHAFFRSGLVSVQYVISIALIACTLIIFQQLRHVRRFPLGFEREQVVAIPLRGPVRTQAEAFKTEVSRLTGVTACAVCSDLPFMGLNETYFTFEGEPEGGRRVLPYTEVDEDYLETLGLDLVAGRNFSPDFPSDQKAVILNQALVRNLGWKAPLGRTISMTDMDDNDEFIEVPYTVIGVVKDFHFESLREQIRGHVLMWKTDVNNLAIKLRPSDPSGSLDRIKGVWEKMNPDRPFEYVFLDDRFDRLFRTERRLGGIFAAFTMIAVFVAGLGLFGLASFSAEQRIKEIGIRRVLGATIPGVAALLSREFTKWVLLANLAAWPIAYYAMHRWLQGFAYRIRPTVGIFLLSGSIALLIALLTISTRTIRAAAASPVRSLRTE